jgi:hypothetical protein
MSEPRYEWKSGRGHRVPAATVGEIISQIEQEKGSCHPGDLVDVARPEDSPIHELFIWDDELAAEQHRVNQARGIIRSLRVVVIEAEERREQVAFVSVSRAEAPHAGYASVTRAMSVETTRNVVIQQALRQLHGIRARYRHLDELAEVWAALDRLEDDNNKAA